MCETCACNLTEANEHRVAEGGPLDRTRAGSESIEVLSGRLAVNLMSPGAGKTWLLEATFGAFGRDAGIAVIEDDPLPRIC